MKIVRENINEAVKHLSGRTPEEIRDFYKNVKMAYYHVDTNKFEYKGKFKEYTLTPNTYSFLRSKDYLIYCKNNIAIGISNAKIMASYLFSHGAVYQRKSLYKKIMDYDLPKIEFEKIINILLDNDIIKYPINEIS